MFFKKNKPEITDESIFQPYYNFEEMIDYDGFIGLDGEFYRVRPSGTVLYSHETWAKQYLQKYWNIKKSNPTYYLTHKIGYIFVNYFASINEITFGIDVVPDEIENEKQRNTVLQLQKYYEKRGELENEENSYRKTK